MPPTADTRTTLVDEGPLRIAVKLDPEAVQAVLTGLTTIDAILNQVGPGLAPTVTVPLFPTEPDERYDALVRRAQDNDPGYRPPQLEAWWDARLDRELPLTVETLNDIVQRFQQLPGVDYAYPLLAGPRPAPLTVAPAGHVLKQGYLGKTGVDADAVRTEVGGRGDGIGFVDVEKGWNLQHDDLKAAGVVELPGENKDCFEHGTAVLGVVLMVEGNGIGGTGIAPDSVGTVVSQFQPDPIQPTPGTVAYTKNTAAAIKAAAAAMQPGDVLLLEVQEYEKVFGTLTAPAEVFLASYEQIELAVKGDRVVVEAAGNGTIDFDDNYAVDGQEIFVRSVRDSGAVLVGGARPTPPHARTGLSNFGERVDCFGWDDKIETTTTDVTGTADTLYALDFGGTSGAAAMVAGAALVVQAMAAPTGRLKPAALRDRLKIGATTSKSPGTDCVGVMPNLRAIADNT